jgi:hypothetical protein
MSRCFVSAMIPLAVALAGTAAAAQKKPAPEAPPCVCPAPAEAPAASARETAYEDCRDGRDNDGDGHVDCADQDCGIYAMCVPGQAAAQAAPAGPPAAAAPAKAYDNMRALKQDLRSGAISGHDFARWQHVIRLRRSAEIDQAKAEFHSGAITRAELEARLREIRMKYEG